MKLHWTLLSTGAVLAGCLAGQAADRVYSGPQPGEPTTPFKVLALSGPQSGKERDPILENAGAPAAIVFIHTIERSLVPLLRIIDEYGAVQSNALRTELVFLSEDRLEGERRVKAANGSLKLLSRVGLSLDGGEGPGNYGLNKDCMITLVTAVQNRTRTNFAFVQPGITDASKVIGALAVVAGDQHPPSVEELSQRHAARTGAAGGRGERMRGDAGSDRAKPKEPFPGAVPTDAKLQGLLRLFIRATNDVATVDRLLGEVKGHIKDSPDLRKQALDGWTRVLHFGDRYGTAYSRKVGTEFLEELKRDTR